MNSIKGWNKVFKFTYLQMVKSKSYIVSTIVIFMVLLLMVLGVNFLPKLLASGAIGGGTSEPGDENGVAFAISKLYISDQSGISPAPDFEFIQQEIGINVEMIGQNQLQEITGRVHDGETEVLIEITDSGFGFNILASRPASDAVINSGNCDFVLARIGAAVHEANLVSIGVPKDKISEADKYVNTQTTIAGETPKNEIALTISSILPMFCALILFMFIFLYSNFTAQSIASEKISRVTETLLTSVRPMAVILGKVLGMGLASFTQFFVMFAAGFGLSAAFAPFGTLGEIFGSAQISSADMQMIKNAFDETFAGFNAMTIVWIVIIFVLGYLFFSLIAGLIGATVSRMEDLQSAMQPLAILGVLGFYLSYISPAFSVGSDSINIMEKISYYLPISSPFSLPGVIIAGKMNSLGTLISVLILAVFNVLMLMLVGRVYETIILHTGDRIKLGAIFRIAGKK